ncbi:MAG: hypothetical protein CYG59_25380 [Chloroflexi bacterium]|nr:MAG: hypothetical protein CYG59_25380 [Chloroflexota bacterium]
MQRVRRPVVCSLVFVGLMLAVTLQPRLALSSPQTTVGGMSLTPLWTTGIISDGAGRAGIIATDLNRDGITDIVTCGAGAPYVLNKVGTGRYDTRWYGEWLRCHKVAVGDRNADGIREIYVATEYTRQVHIYDGATFAQVGQLTLDPTQEITDLAVANVDDVAGSELVILLADATLVYNAHTLELKWAATGKGGTQLGLANIDGGGRREIVVNGVPARVLNAAAKTEKWSYADGFGRHMTVGNVDDDAYAEIVYTARSSSDDYLYVFDGDTRLTKWRVGPSFNLSNVVAVGDTDRDGVKEVVTGSGQWGSISGYHGSTGAPLWSMKNPENGVFGLTVGDPDNDGNNEIIWSSGLDDSGKDALLIGDRHMQAIEWRSDDLDGPLHVAAGDLDRDGRMELVVVSTTTDTGYGDGIVRVYDAASRRLKWSTRTSPQPWLEIHQVSVGQLDDDAALEIVVGGAEQYEARIQVYDGKTHAIEWESPALAPIGNVIREIQLEVANVDADAQAEIITGFVDGHVQIIDGKTKTVQWDSGALDSPIRDLSIGQLDRDGPRELAVATSYGAYVFDLGTYGREWRADLRINDRPANPSLTIVDRTATHAGDLVISTSPYKQEQTMQVWSGTPLSRRWQMTRPDSVITDMTSRDLNGDGTEEVVLMGHYQSTATAAAPSLLLVASRSSDGYHFDYRHPGAWGSIKEVVFADVDNDQQRELVFAADTLIQVNKLTLPSSTLAMPGSGPVSSDGSGPANDE